MKINESNYLRDASPNEILYSHFQDIYTTLSIQFVIEGSGEIGTEEFEEAVKIASEKCPGARGSLKNGKWIDSRQTPPIFYLENIDFDGYDFSKSEVFKRKINFRENPAAEVFFINTNPFRMVFRVFHGAMDGKGVLIWVGNIFKALRGEELIEARSKETDLTFVKSLKANKFKSNLRFKHRIYKKRSNPHHQSCKYEIYWRRITISGTYPGLIAKIAKIVTDSFDDESNKFLIPVDIRRHKKDIISTANLALPIFLETNKSNTWEEINGSLLNSLKNSKELNLNNADLGYISRLPDRMLKSVMGLSEAFQKFTGKHMIGGIISHLGKVDLKDFSTRNFAAENFFSMPVEQPLVPISMVAVESKNTTELVAAAYKSVIPEEECEKMLLRIEDFLTGKSIYEKINRTAKNCDEKNVIDLFKEHVKSNPDALALIYEKESLTYKELDRRSDILAGILKQNGIRKSDYVMLYLNRSFDLIISIMAVLKAGAAYVPIDINYPLEKVKYILSGGIKTLISEEKFEDRLQEVSSVNIILAEKIDYSKDIAFEKAWREPHNIAYQIYTSGSTGNPKGVEIEDRSLMNYLYWAKREYEIKASNRFPLFTTVAADLTITSIFLPLISGGSIEIYSDATNHWVLEQILDSQEIDCIKLAPTHLRLIQSLNPTLQNKKLLIIGGEQLDTRLASDAQKLFGENCKIVNEYGPTEATVGCVFHIFDESKKCYGTSVPIGLPIDNTKLLLLDEKQKLVRVGEIGELYILGDCLAKGYSNNEELNQKMFVYINGERAYRTGDLAKLTPENHYVYLGRNDSQIKVSGYRIEPGEIEVEIAKFKGIENAIVIASDKGLASAYLKAYFTAKEKIDVFKLREYLRNKLPSYMVPKKLLQIEEIPMSQSGKTALDLLPEINEETVDINYSDTTYSEEQLRLLEIWGQILNIEEGRIGLDDNFYNLGGDSVGLIRMLSDISKDIGDTKEDRFREIISTLYNDITINNLEKTILKLRSKSG